MKRIVVLLSFLLAGCDNIEPMADGETIHGDRYEVASEGNDLRVYEWVSPASGRHCIFVAGTSKGGLQCWPTMR